MREEKVIATAADTSKDTVLTLYGSTRACSINWTCNWEHIIIVTFSGWQHLMEYRKGL